MTAVVRDVTEEEVDAFERDGVVCLRGILSVAWVESVAAALDELLSQGHTYGADAAVPIRGDNWLAVKYPGFAEYSLSPGLAGIAAGLLRSGSVNLYSDGYLVKEPGCEPTTPWHQDLPYYPVSGTQMLSLWIALDPVTADTGAVEYLAGSHRWPGLLRPVSFDRPDDPRYAAYAETDLESVPDIDADRSRWDIVSWDLEPGDLTAHHARTVHYAGCNRSSSVRRRALTFRFAGDDVRWSPGATYHDLGGERFPIDPGLAPGDELRSPLFPRLWPARSAS